MTKAFQERVCQSHYSSYTMDRLAKGYFHTFPEEHAIGTDA